MNAKTGQLVAIFANLGVVVGLVLLTIELQQNNRLLAGQSRGFRAQIMIDYLDELAGNPEISRIIVNARNGELSDDEQIRLAAFRNSLLFRWQALYREYQAGLVPIEDFPFEGWRGFFTGPTSVPGMTEFWHARARMVFPEDFVEFMDENVVRSDDERP